MPDEVLEKLIITDAIWEEIILLAEYDFDSDLNVNVLGHIFEQSVTDLEEIRKDLEETKKVDDPQKDKTPGDEIQRHTNKNTDLKFGERKRKGIYYTPEYITKYIIDNTVGRYLEEFPEKIKDIKILDPACGSGAFLNQAHSFLLNEYKIRTEEIQTKKAQKGEKLTLWDSNFAENDKSILLNNLFGVDLSPESVEITKLSLWLKTAKSSEPLQNLDSNIKCGNSLINDSEIAGNKAFNWNEEFKEIISKGGFDVIIGNPPYVSTKQIPPIERDYFWKYYSGILQYEMDLYELFMYKCFTDLLANNGYLGFITPSSFFSTDSFKLLREYIFSELELINIVDFPYRFFPFSDVNTETCIHVYRKRKPLRNNTRMITVKKEKYIPEIVIDFDFSVKQSDFCEIFEGKIITRPKKTFKDNPQTRV